jgi:hypothetical protein
VRGRPYVRAAPASLVFLFTSAVAWWTLRDIDPQTRQRLVLHASTNLHNMRRDPIRVLVVSAFWSGNSRFPWSTLAEFLILMVPAERWLGTRRWVAAFAAGHVGATLVTVSGIRWAIHHDVLPVRAAHQVDVGASYGVAAVAALLTYRFTDRRVQLAWAGSLLTFLAAGAWRGQSFTDYGHLSAALIGLALYPLAATGTEEPLRHPRRPDQAPTGRISRLRPRGVSSSSGPRSLRRRRP